MSIWCPKCRYKSVLKRFYDDRCPQCRTVVGIGEALTKDPYQPEVGARSGRRGSRSGDVKKKFVFDQKGGSDGTTTPGSIPSIPTETLGLFDTGKK